MIALLVFGAAACGWILASFAMSGTLGDSRSVMLWSAASSFVTSVISGMVTGWPKVWVWPVGLTCGLILKLVIEAQKVEWAGEGMLSIGIIAIVVLLPVFCAGFIGAAAGAWGRSRLSRTSK